MTLLKLKLNGERGTEEWQLFELQTAQISVVFPWTTTISILDEWPNWRVPIEKRSVCFSSELIGEEVELPYPFRVRAGSHWNKACRFAAHPFRALADSRD